MVVVLITKVPLVSSFCGNPRACLPRCMHEGGNSITIEGKSSDLRDFHLTRTAPKYSFPVRARTSKNIFKSRRS